MTLSLLMLIFPGRKMVDDLEILCMIHVPCISHQVHGKSSHRLRSKYVRPRTRIFSFLTFFTSSGRYDNSSQFGSMLTYTQRSSKTIMIQYVSTSPHRPINASRFCSSKKGELRALMRLPHRLFLQQKVFRGMYCLSIYCLSADDL